MTARSFKLFSVFALLILLFSLFRPTIALAEDGAPPEVTPEAVVTEAPESPSKVVEAPTEAPLPAETPVAEAPAERSLIEQLPENTDLVVLDANGESLSLASQAAEEVLETGDPMWCPDGQNPATDLLLDGHQDCTKSFKRFTGNATVGLIAALEAASSGDGGPSGPGTIYVQAGPIASDDQDKTITLNGNSLTNFQDYNLTIQGGWDFIANQQTDLQSVFVNSRLVIVNWNGNLTLNQLDFEMSNSSPKGPALQIGDAYSGDSGPVGGDVTLNHVNAKNARKGDGANINAYGAVTVNDSEFQQNNRAGLVVEAGTVSLNNVYSFSNGDEGASLFANPFAGGSVTVTGGAFHDNGRAGLSAEGVQLTIQDVNASSNYRQGVDLYAYPPYGASDEPITPSITILGGSFTDNRLQGIRAEVSQPGDGYSFLTGDIFINGAWVESNGTEPKGPDRSGIRADAANVTLQQVTSNRNGLDGANLNATNTVTVLNSTFLENATKGLAITENYGSSYGGGQGYAFSVEPGFSASSEADSFVVQVACSTSQRNRKGLVVDGTGMTYLDSNTITDNTVLDLQIFADAYANVTGLCSSPSNPEPPADEPEHPRVKPKYNRYLTSFEQGTLPGCARANGRILYTVNSDEVQVPCGPGGEAFASNSEYWKLPHGLFQGGFVDAIRFNVIKDDEKNRAVLPVSVVISFDLPYGETANWAIMYWNGEKWIDLADAAGGNRIVTSPGVVNGYRFEAIVNFTGLFALVRK